MTPGQGDWLGERYQLLEPLGIGGMGVVYTAFDTKLQRKVAVKRLRELAAAASAERRRARFLREAQLLASLSHPNVLTVHDVGGVDPELYVVMELVDGWPMSRWISEAEPRPDWRRILDLYEQVGRGLSAAHQLGVVHRDVKPENILVARSGRVLIGDFGLAGLAEAGGVTAGSGRRPDRADADRDRAGHARVHGARAARRQAGGHAVRSVFVLRVAVRVAARAAAVPGADRGRDRGGGARRPPGRRAATASRARSIASSRAAWPSIPRQRHPSMDALLGALAGAREPRPRQADADRRARSASCWRRPRPPRSSRTRRQPTADRPSGGRAAAPPVVVSPPPAAPRRAAGAARGRRAPPAAPRARGPAGATPPPGAAARRARPRVGAPAPGDRPAAAARPRRRLARRSQRGGLPRRAQQDAARCLAADAERPRPAPARHLRDAARQLRQGTPPARAARRRRRQPRRAARELPGRRRCRRSTIGSARGRARRPTRRATPATRRRGARS